MKTSTLLLLAGAGLLVAHQLRKPSPVNGMMMPGMGEVGGLKKKFKKAAKKVGGGIKQVKAVGKTVAQVAQKYDPGTKLVTKAAQQVAKIAPKSLNKIVARVSIGGKRIGAPGGAPAPAAGQEVEYQDENGNVISATEYHRRMAEMERAAQQAAQQAAQPQAPQVQQQPQQPQAPAQQFDWSQYMPSAPSSGGGGAPSMLPPAASTPAPSVTDTAAPAQKMNPLLTAAAFIGVPVVLMLTGEK